jgi:uncharacterized protein
VKKNKIIKLLSTTLAFLLSSNVSFASDDGPQIASPSFNCAKARTNVEKEICSSNLLSGLDIWLSEVYKKSLNIGNSKKVKSEQLLWLKSRSSCLSKSRNGYYGRSGLEECYSNRIRELIEQNKIDTNTEFYRKLAKRMGVKIPIGFKSAGEGFVFSINISEQMTGFFDDHCNYNKETVVYYKSPILITTVNGSTVCGGTSHAISAKNQYCEKDGEFYKGSVWACKPENIIDKDFLLSYIAANSFLDFYGDRTKESNNNIFIDYLYSFPIHSLSESSNHVRLSRVFSDSYIKIIEDNIELFLGIAELHKEDFNDVVLGMSCVLENIKNKENWKDIFGSYKPDWSGNNWYGQQFEGCNTYNKYIIGQNYTYKELYVELWRRLYFSGGMNRAIKILKSLEGKEHNKELKFVPAIKTASTGRATRTPFS